MRAVHVHIRINQCWCGQVAAKKFNHVDKRVADRMGKTNDSSTDRCEYRRYRRKYRKYKSIGEENVASGTILYKALD